VSKLQKKESRSVAQICEAFRRDGLNAYAKGGANLRHKGNEGEVKRKEEYRPLLRLTRQILNDSRRVFPEGEALPPRCRREVSGRGERLEAMADQVRRVVGRLRRESSLA
jgi:hypothetical protein